MNWVKRSGYFSAVSVSSKNNGTTIRFRNAANQTWFFDKCRGFSRSACGFSAHHAVLFRFEWNHAPSVEKSCLSSKPLRVKNPCSGLQTYRGTGSHQQAVNCTERISKCWKCSSPGGGLVSYMFVSVFTVLTHVSFLGCVLHGTFCTCAACFLPTPCLSLVRSKLTQLQIDITEHVFSCYMVNSLLGRTVTPALPHG